MKTNNSSAPASGDYLPGIDGIRCIAVLAVVANHLSSNILESGFLGVDVFFVVSGFVITKSLLRYPNVGLPEQLLTFYTRRFKRLLPALLVFVVITCIIACLFNPTPRTTILTGIFALFGLSNIYLLLISSDYFGGSASLNFFTHTWSLGVEEQFYFVYPLLFFFCYKICKNANWRKRLLLILLVCSTASVAMFIVTSRYEPEIVFYSLPFRLWEIGIGATICLSLTSHKLVRVIKYIPDCRLLIIFLTAILALPIAYQTWTTIASVLLSGLILLKVHQDSSDCSILKLDSIRLIGQFSYSLYLWHWGVIVTAKWTIGVNIFTAPFLLLAMFALAYLSYQYVEKPLRHKQWFESNFKTVLFSLFILPLIAITIFGILHKNSDALFQGNTNSDDAQRISTSIEDLKPDNGVGKRISQNLQTIRSNCHMTPHLHTGAQKLEKPIVDKKFITDCVDGENPKIILVGDSFSNSVAEHLALSAVELEMDFRMVYGFACPYPLNKAYIAHSNPRKCDVDTSLLRETLEEFINPGDILVLRLFLQSSMYLKEQEISDIAVAYDAELDRLSKSVEAKGAGLIVIGSNWQVDNLTVCRQSYWYNSFQCSKDNDVYVNMTSHIRNRYAIRINNHLTSSLHDETGFIRFINPLALLCDEAIDKCPLKKNQILFLRDDTHLSLAAVDLLFDFILEEVRSLKAKL